MQGAGVGVKGGVRWGWDRGQEGREDSLTGSLHQGWGVGGSQSQQHSSAVLGWPQEGVQALPNPRSISSSTSWKFESLTKTQFSHSKEGWVQRTGDLEGTNPPDSGLYAGVTPPSNYCRKERHQMALPTNGWALTPETQPDSGRAPSRGQHPCDSKQRVRPNQDCVWGSMHPAWKSRGAV